MVNILILKEHSRENRSCSRHSALYVIILKYCPCPIRPKYANPNLKKINLPIYVIRMQINRISQEGNCVLKTLTHQPRSERLKCISYISK